MNPKILAEVTAEMERARAKWAELDATNTSEDFILYALAYIGRATPAARNNREDKHEMLIKAIGLLARAAELS